MGEMGWTVWRSQICISQDHLPRHVGPCNTEKTMGTFFKDEKHDMTYFPTTPLSSLPPCLLAFLSVPNIYSSHWYYYLSPLPLESIQVRHPASLPYHHLSQVYNLIRGGIVWPHKTTLKVPNLQRWPTKHEKHQRGKVIL